MGRLVDTVKVAVIQLLVGRDKQVNLARAASKVKEACEGGAQLVILPVRGVVKCQVLITVGVLQLPLRNRFF